MTNETQPFSALTLPKTCARTGLGRSMLYGLIKEGKFPKPAKVGRRAIFSSEEVDAWLRARFAERDAQQVAA